MTILYCGVDFHARQQTCCLTTENGELAIHEIKHQDKAAVRAFYRELPKPVIVGLEASGYSPWLKHYWKNSATKYGLDTPLKSGAALAADKRMTVVTRN